MAKTFTISLTTLREITEAEWLLVQTDRAEKATGYPIHVDDDGLYYCWPMGTQPSGKTLRKILGSTPWDAAQLFLSRYRRRFSLDTWAQPVRLPK